MTIDYNFLDIAPGGRIRYLKPAPQWTDEVLTFNTINKLGEGTMEEDKGAALNRIAEQYELVADLLGKAYTYAGVLGRKEIMAAFITAFDTLDTELDDDFERVDEEPEELKIDVQPNRPGMPFPTTPHPYPPPPSVPSRTITNQSDDR